MKTTSRTVPLWWVNSISTSKRKDDQCISILNKSIILTVGFVFQAIHVQSNNFHQFIIRTCGNQSTTRWPSHAIDASQMMFAFLVENFSRFGNRFRANISSVWIRADSEHLRVRANREVVATGMDVNCSNSLDIFQGNQWNKGRRTSDVLRERERHVSKTATHSRSITSRESYLVTSFSVRALALLVGDARRALIWSDCWRRIETHSIVSVIHFVVFHVHRTVG